MIKQNNIALPLKTAAELHEHVPPDWYFASIKRNLLQRWWHNSRFSAVEAVIEPVGGKILDIGSADGVFTNVISKKSKASLVLGIDVLPHSVAWANKHWRGSRMKFMVADAHRLSFPSRTFDAVFALEVLEHVYKPEEVLKEIKRVLKRNGYAVFLVPSDSKLFLFVWFIVRNFWWAKIWNDTHVQSYKKSSLTKISRKIGFKVEVDKKFWLGMLHLVKVRKI